MVGTRGRKILHDIGSRKVRTLLVSISIFIGVFGTVTLFTMGDQLPMSSERVLPPNPVIHTRPLSGVGRSLFGFHAFSLCFYYTLRCHKRTLTTQLNGYGENFNLNQFGILLRVTLR